MTKQEQRELFLEAARHLRGELPSLMTVSKMTVADASIIDSELARILQSANLADDDDAEIQIRRLASEHDALLEWVAAFMREHAQTVYDGTRSFQRLPGTTSIGYTLFRCPKNDYVWAQRNVGMEIPKCETHHISLIEDTKPVTLGKR